MIMIRIQHTKNHKDTTYSGLYVHVVFFLFFSGLFGHCAAEIFGAEIPITAIVSIYICLIDGVKIIIRSEH